MHIFIEEFLEFDSTIKQRQNFPAYAAPAPQNLAGRLLISRNEDIGHVVNLMTDTAFAYARLLEESGFSQS